MVALPENTRELPPEVVALLPEQGHWSERDYLWLTSRTNRLVELVDGRIEVLHPPTDRHQAVLQAVFVLLRDFVRARGGVARFSPLRVRTVPGHVREPDVVMLFSSADPRRHDECWDGADLVVEVVGADDPKRDTVEKREEYARAGFCEYWVVNPLTESVTVLRLEGGSYMEHGCFRRGQQASSPSMAGFAASVDAILDAP
ncbi:MAG: Uma2 family endonuclease [Myxococcota bacterium]